MIRDPTRVGNWKLNHRNNGIKADQIERQSPVRFHIHSDLCHCHSLPASDGFIEAYTKKHKSQEAGITHTLILRPEVPQCSKITFGVRWHNSCKQASKRGGVRHARLPVSLDVSDHFPDWGVIFFYFFYSILFIDLICILYIALLL